MPLAYDQQKENEGTPFAQHHFHKCTINRIAHLVNYVAKHLSSFKTFKVPLK